MNAETDVALCGDLGLTGVECHPNADLFPRGPGVLGKGALGGDCCPHPVVGPAERDEERVSLGVYLMPAVLGEDCSKEPTMNRQDVSVAIPGGVLSSRVEPSTSVNRNVTVPLGRSPIAACP
jgi:hypothetical protein